MHWALFGCDRSCFSTVGQKFLRGYQDTNANGLAEFVTIYPVGIQAERFTSTLRFAPILHPRITSLPRSFT